MMLMASISSRQGQVTVLVVLGDEIMLCWGFLVNSYLSRQERKS